MEIGAKGKPRRNALTGIPNSSSLTAMIDECEHALSRLLRYCRSESWAGYDPYDGLNSPLAHSFLFKHRLTRTLLTQLVKRSPFNLRPILRINKELNPKGVALAARAVILLADLKRCSLPSKTEAASESHQTLQTDFSFLMGKLGSLRTPNFAESCWGYNFDWQSRAFFAPRGTPNVVCTAFAAHAYLDWHERTGNEEALDVATSSCRFLLDELNRFEEPGSQCFSYTPLDHSRVHNVNMLAAELLARTFTKTGRDEFRDAAHRAVGFTLARQKEDGSWAYGEAESQGWIDSFHTGFVLVSLKHLIDYLGVEGWRTALDVGYRFYENQFFLADGTPRYYHERLHPHDVHSAAQGAIT
ncbi:MAG: hypothetical protein WAV47_16810, partial [Blastocatellia bacterium]